MDSFDDKISVVPSRLKFFYGINAVYILFIFVFPLITPFISILSFASFAWRLTTFRKEGWEDDSQTSLFTKIVMVIASLIPIFCTVSIIPEFLELPLFLWNNIWLEIIEYLFVISYSLFTALSIGSLIILFSNSGISEYEQLFADNKQKKSFANVKVLEVFLFGFFLFLDLYNFPIIDLIYTAGLVIVIFTYIVNMIRGKSKYGSFKSYFVGYFIAAVFIGSNVILTSTEVSSFLRTWSLLISAILYIFILFYTFITIED
jgi:MFS family permease